MRHSNDLYGAVFEPDAIPDATHIFLSFGFRAGAGWVLGFRLEIEPVPSAENAGTCTTLLVVLLSNTDGNKK